MGKNEYIRQCLLDAISALDVAYDTPTTQPIQIGNDYIYPQIALERLRSVLNADKLFKVS